MRSGLQAAARLPVTKLRDWTRAGEWWEDKLVPTLSLFYMTASLGGVSIASLAPSLTLLLLALIPGAIYVSLVNDLTDRKEDHTAGKANRWARMPRWLGILLLALSVGAGAAFAFAWRNDALRLLPYLGAWLAFSCYSLPPIRLKVRGGAGVAADAAGAHMFPALLAAALAFRATPMAPDPIWLGAVAVWSLAYGVRGILRHQLADAEADAVARVPTFVQRHGAAATIRLGSRVVAPIEVAALVLLLWRMQGTAATAALAAYLLAALLRRHQMDMPIDVVSPRWSSQMFLQDYYGVFLPAFVLLGSCTRHPADGFVLAVHVLLYPRRAFWLFRDLWEGEADADHARRHSLAARLAKRRSGARSR